METPFKTENKEEEPHGNVRAAPIIFFVKVCSNADEIFLAKTKYPNVPYSPKLLEALQMCLIRSTLFVPRNPWAPFCDEIKIRLHFYFLLMGKLESIIHRIIEDNSFFVIENEVTNWYCTPFQIAGIVWIFLKLITDLF